MSSIRRKKGIRRPKRRVRKSIKGRNRKTMTPPIESIASLRMRLLKAPMTITLMMTVLSLIEEVAAKVRVLASTVYPSVLSWKSSIMMRVSWPGKPRTITIKFVRWRRTCRMHNEIGGKRMGEAKLTTMRRLTRWMMSWRMITITAIRSIRRFYKSNKPKEEVFSLQQVILNSGKSRSKKEWRKQPLWRCSTSPLTLLESKSH